MDASNITENNITTKIADGSISPHDRHHYEMALISIQKRGIKGEGVNEKNHAQNFQRLWGKIQTANTNKKHKYKVHETCLAQDLQRLWGKI